MLAQGVTTRLDPSAEGWAIWVREEDQVARAAQELAEFKARPDDPRYASAAATADALRREADRRERQFRRNYVEVRQRWSPRGGAQPLTLLLVAISVLVYLAAPLGGRLEPLENALLLTSADEASAANPAYRAEYPWYEVRHGQPWRLVTPMVLHGSLLHLAFNMLWLLDLGGQIERTRGTWRLAAMVLATQTVSAVAQVQWEGPYFGGMSGVVYGLFGYVWMKCRYDPPTAVYVSPSNVWIMLAWLLACMTGLLGPVANAAHVAGLMCGMAIGLAPLGWRRLRRQA